MKKKDNINSYASVRTNMEFLKKEINGAELRSHNAVDKLKAQTAEKLNEVSKAGYGSFDSVNRLLHSNEMNPNMLSPFKTAYEKNLALAQNIMGQIIKAQNETMTLSSGFLESFLGIIGSADFNTEKASEQLFNLVKEHIQTSSDHSANSVMELLETYHNFFKYSMQFNRNFANIVLTEMLKLAKIQNKNNGIFAAGNMVADWWNK